MKTTANSLQMPAAFDAEKGLLGSILLAPTRVLDELPWLSPGHFYHPAHATIFRRMLEMRKAYKPIDLISLTQALEDAKIENERGVKLSESELDRVGGAAAITELFTFVPTASNAAYYGEVVNEKYTRRGIICAAMELERKARMEPDCACEDLLEECDKLLSQLRKDTSWQCSLKHVREILPAVCDEIEQRHKHRDQTFGLPTGFCMIWTA